MLKAGDLLSDRYEIEKVLGQGGMGAVYLARDTRIPTRWAVKEMSDAFADPAERDEAVETFKAEARILSGLNHPNLPRITDHFSDEGRQYLVMDFVEGVTLEAMLEEQKQLPVATVIDLAIQITEVLDYLHTRDKPVIFRDFKPGNVMVTPEGKAKLIDFGIARHFSSGKSSDTRALGTPGYAAPEQYGKGQSDPRTDIYALGATLYQALTGHDPTENPFVFPAFREQRPEVPEALEAIILRCVSLKADERFPTASALREALEKLREDPAAYRHLPDRLKTAPLAPPTAMGFEPRLLRFGPVKRGDVARGKVVLRGDFDHKLKATQKWLSVQPNRVQGNNVAVEVSVSTAKMVDGGNFQGELTVAGYPELEPLRVEVAVEPNHVTVWTLALAFMFCLGSFIPLAGYVTTGLLLSVFLATPRGERAVLKAFLVVAILASIGWTALGTLIGFGLTKVDWSRVNPWKQPQSQPASPTPSGFFLDARNEVAYRTEKRFLPGAVLDFRGGPAWDPGIALEEFHDRVS
ncbi:MAG: serine/threonine-protein kinase [Vulcanimicrobiota bacterium]